jgi:hypothetical protein
MTVRRDAVTEWRTHLAGGSPRLRSFVQARESKWRWWNEKQEQSRRPMASLIVLKPGQPFEVGAPERGVAVRVRLWAENNGQAVPGVARAELMDLRVDGRSVETQIVESKQDRYHLVNLPDEPGQHRVEARARGIQSGIVVNYQKDWIGRAV